MFVFDFRQGIGRWCEAISRLDKKWYEDSKFLVSGSLIN